MKNLILNADDFGLSSGANRAVVKAYREGILTSTSLMVGGRTCEEAVALAKENPGLQVGLHLTLLQGRAVSPPESVPGLVDQEGNFPIDPTLTGMRYFFRRSLRRQLCREIEAQIIRFRETGLSLSHLDGHLNIHMHPTVFAILAELMPKYGITSFRLTREDPARDPGNDGTRRFGRRLDAFIFARLAGHCRPVLERLGIFHADEVKGLLNSGMMTEDYLLKVLDCLGDGCTEIYFHPGCLPDPELAAWMPEYRHEEELAALTSRTVREKINQLGIRLGNYRGEERNDV
ncbi:MAG TPA: hopanoid biosynthesis-associated protein HpnK [Geobacteraceae bacterium]|mgnify:CR=1 FL=1|nr:hopanoid biosynthesis-associated protein HpnK [Geobacteraceae bacterium]